MRLAQDYLQLRQALPQSQLGKALAVTMNDIAGFLFCTQRNAKLILTKMEALGWIRFVPGLGRGKPSRITFLLESEKAIERVIEELVRSGELEEAFQLVKQYGEGTSYTKERFFDWLSRYFGYSVEEDPHKREETLRLPIFREISSLDPAQVFYSFEVHLVSQIYNTLILWNEETNRMEGAVAHSWKMEDSATRWTFYLRKGIPFHHGRELTAEDVRFSLQRLAQANFRQSWLAKDIADIETLSRYSLKITLKRPNYLFLTYLSYPPTSIVPHDLYRPDEEWAEANPVGTGPYRVSKWSPTACFLEAFDHHFSGRPFIDHIEIRSIPEEDKRLLKASSGLLFVHTGEGKDSEGTDNGNWQKDRLVTGCMLFTMNLQKEGILRDLNFRRALSCLADRNRMTGELGFPRQDPAYGFALCSSSPAMDGEEQRQKGLAYLQASSYQGESIYLYTFQRHAPDAYWLKEEYEKYGIQLEVVIVPWRELMRPEIIQQADLILFEFVLTEGVIRLLESFQALFIRSHLSDELAQQVDQHLQALLAQPASDEREDGLRGIEHLLIGQQALIFLVTKSITSAAPSSLHNVKVNQRGWVDFHKIWFE